MTEHWLDIQSFLVDQKVLAAIDNLSIALKFDLAGVHDPEREKLAASARENLANFLERLEEVSTTVEAGVVKGVDPRFKELADAFVSARQDTGNFHSTLMKAGAQATLALLHADDARAKRELLSCLTDLRRVVEGHQQTDASMILEDF